MRRKVLALSAAEVSMSRWVLIAVAAASVLLAQFVDRGSKDLAEGLQTARAPVSDDDIRTGSVRRPPQR
jgi:hypothetical protein